jgi:sec-independent protein translocase protein TatB
MFDIGAQEILVIVVVAILVIGPKELPTAMRTAGRWIGKMRRMSAHFRTGLDSMIREAEMEEMEKKWKAQNEKIMRQHPDGGPAEMEQTGAYPPPRKGDAQPDAASAEGAAPTESPPPTGPDEEKKAD